MAPRAVRLVVTGQPRNSARRETSWPAPAPRAPPPAEMGGAAAVVGDDGAPLGDGPKEIELVAPLGGAMVGVGAPGLVLAGKHKNGDAVHEGLVDPRHQVYRPGPDGSHAHPR